nr:hypothetical protein [Escherichia coli]
MLGVVLAIIVTGLVIFMLAKGYKPQPVLLLGGLLLMGLTVVFDLGTLLPEKTTTHFQFFDIFKVFSDIMSTRLAGLGLTLMAIAGFSRYMDHVGASKALFAVFEKPLRSVGRLICCWLSLF